MENTKQTIREFIIQEFLPGEDAGNLTDSLDLLRSGILDSLATLKLVAFLEEHFGIEMQAHEANPDNLRTVADIAALVDRKKSK